MRRRRAKTLHAGAGLGLALPVYNTRGPAPPTVPLRSSRQYVGVPSRRVGGTARARLRQAFASFPEVQRWPRTPPAQSDTGNHYHFSSRLEFSLLRAIIFLLESRVPRATRCVHYRRKCKIRAPCCGEVFDCRHCHNEAKVRTSVFAEFCMFRPGSCGIQA